GGVPDRRLAGLGPQAVAVLDHERAPALDRPSQGLVLEPAAERGEHHDRPDPRRLDPAPASIRFLAVLDPRLRRREGAAAQRARARRPFRLSWTGADLPEVDVSR